MPIAGCWLVAPDEASPAATISVSVEAPGNFEDADSGAKAFELERFRQLDTGGGEGGIIAAQMLVGGLADKNAASARGPFQAAGQVYLPNQKPCNSLIRPPPSPSTRR